MRPASSGLAASCGLGALAVVLVAARARLRSARLLGEGRRSETELADLRAARPALSPAVPGGCRGAMWCSLGAVSPLNRRPTVLGCCLKFCRYILTNYQ